MLLLFVGNLTMKSSPVVEEVVVLGGARCDRQFGCPSLSSHQAQPGISKQATQSRCKVQLSAGN
jgi:hypothetical protein